MYACIYDACINIGDDLYVYANVGAYLVFVLYSIYGLCCMYGTYVRAKSRVAVNQHINIIVRSPHQLVCG
jgi:hypothetical protein